MIKVALVDDQQLVRAGFRMLIDSQPDLQVVAEAGDGAEAIRSLTATPADVVLMDVRMPVLDGIAATSALTSQNPNVKVIVLTTFDLDEYVLSAIRAGASGFLLKDAEPEVLLSAIRTVYLGDAVIAPSATKRLLSHLIVSPGKLVLDAVPGQHSPETTLGTGQNPTPLDRAIASLTSRELEVLKLIAKGRSNTEIAAELFVSETTVKTHVGRIFMKLGARDRVQAVVAAYEAGLVAPEIRG